MNRSLMTWRLGALAMALGLMLGCASLGGGGLESRQYREALGNASSTDLARHGVAVLNHHQYRLDQSAQGAALVYLETFWRPRAVFPDEEANGVTDAETRIVVQGRERSTAGLGRVVSVQFVAENRVRLEGAPQQWTHVPPTPMYLDYVKTIAADLKRELETGIRVY